MRVRAGIAIALIAAVGFAGAVGTGTSGAAAPEATTARAPRTTSPANTKALGGLAAARSRWKAKGPKGDYRYALSLSCFCPVIPKGVVTVRRGKPGRPIAGLPGSERTIIDWFTFIETTAPQVASLTVEYDRIDGHPKSIAVDVDLRIADEESYYALTDIRRLRRR